MFWLQSIIVFLYAASAVAGEGSGIEFFERKIRPLLAENCFSCHGTEKQKGELRLDYPDFIRAGGESGPIFVPGKPAESRIIQAVSYKSDDLKMPPKKRLSEQQVAVLTEWIARGAPMPEGSGSIVKAPRKEFQITEKDRAHWAFQPVRRPALSAGEGAIDALIGRELKKKKLSMNPRATSRELIRRAYFDLIGLPPSPEEVAAFEADESPRAFAKVIDELLARPQYGERWARHWLDLARFAQSDGYERDGEKPLAWRYRDYVIAAFNRDKPYDRFVMEQIAGDELPDATGESVAATAFQRLGVSDDEPDDKVLAEYDALDDVLSTTSTTFLGITLGCARCHDHKFDPIPQADYYSMLASFRNVRPYESAPKGFDAPAFAPMAPPAEVKAWLARATAELPAAIPTEEKVRKAYEAKKLELRDKAPFEWTLAVRERGTNPPVTRVLTRGNPATPAAEVEPAFLRALAPWKPDRITPPEHGGSSGRRLALARWIASPQNPLTARVLVNRVWQHHFGKGLVKTPSDFGMAGSPPTHPELLDWLAAEFVDSGWSIKKLHKVIMLSRAYQQSSLARNHRASSVDPGNDLLWRQNLRRLEAEAIRDTILSVSGSLDGAMGGRGFFPHLSGEVLAGQSRPGLDWQVSGDREVSRRSIYAFVRRTMQFPLLETLDYNNTSSPVAERAVTTVAPQVLTLLNDEFLHQQAEAFATRLVRAAGNDPGKQIERAYQLALNRPPSSEEIKIARAWLKRQEQGFAKRASQITFRPDVGAALSTEYFNQLKAEQFLIGPRASWKYHRGFWAPPYEGIRVVERERSPFALHESVGFVDGVLHAELSFSASTEVVGILVRAKAAGDLADGYEAVFDPRAQKISLVKHGTNTVAVAEMNAVLPVGKPIHTRVEFKGPRIDVDVNRGAHVLMHVDANPSTSGSQIGVRVWGGAATLNHLRVVSNGGGGINIEPDRIDPAFRALQSFALLIFNLNELIYVD